MHATSIADNAVGKPTPFRNPFRMLIHPEPWLALIFALTSFVIGLIWFVLHVTFFSIGVSLIFALFGIPILVAWLYVWVWGASLERARVRSDHGQRDSLAHDGGGPVLASLACAHT